MKEICSVLLHWTEFDYAGKHVGDDGEPCVGLIANAQREFPGREFKVEPPFEPGLDIGLSRVRCPDCNAHLAKSGICLNACHLTQDQRNTFNAMMRQEV